MSKTALSLGEYMGTPEGDRLSTLAAGYRMTFREKIQFSEEAERLAETFAEKEKRQLHQALNTWGSR